MNPSFYNTEYNFAGVRNLTLYRDGRKLIMNISYTIFFNYILIDLTTERFASASRFFDIICGLFGEAGKKFTIRPFADLLTDVVENRVSRTKLLAEVRQKL